MSVSRVEFVMNTSSAVNRFGFIHSVLYDLGTIYKCIWTKIDLSRRRESCYFVLRITIDSKHRQEHVRSIIPKT